jgi:hypothetical protein
MIVPMRIRLFNHWIIGEGISQAGCDETEHQVRRYQLFTFALQVIEQRAEMPSRVSSAAWNPTCIVR